MFKEDYIDILMQSLQKKNNILDKIQAANKRQQLLLRDENLLPEDFEQTVDDKAKLIDELNQLDEGFEQLYAKVKPDIEAHMEQYADQIKAMQEIISRIVEKTMSVQAEEMRNKALIENKFSTVKKQIRDVKASQKMVNSYYSSMMKTNYVDAQFLDRKK